MSAALSVLAFAGVIGAYTYIAFTLTEVSGFATATVTVPWLLVLFGIGNIVGGKAADRALNASLGVLLALVTAVLAVFALTATDQAMTVVCLLLLATVGLATAPGLQLRIVSHAKDAPTVASGLNIAAFDVGNALGAWLVWVGAGISLVGPVVLVAGSASRQGRPVPAEGHA